MRGLTENDVTEQRAATLFLSSRSPRDVVTYDGTFDELVTEASFHLSDGGRFGDTKLFGVLGVIVDHCGEIIIWYSHYLDGLEAIRTRSDFIEYCEMCVRTEYAEVYCHYKI